MSLTAREVETLIREGVPMANDIDLRVELIADKRALARIPFNDRMLRPGGSLSGPVQMALSDATMYAAVLGTLGAVEMAVTSNLSINFLRRPAAVDLYADARVLKMGARLAYCEVRLTSAVDGVYDEHSELVAHVTGTYALPGPLSPPPVGGNADAHR
ncbi:MAG: PaaI family thioesterase [Halomonadaceae bacterium]|nr:MAG: PaaI family thioesterase [Halomonadaceae bacterium]